MDEPKFTLVEHLEELRKRLFVCILSVSVFSVLSYAFCGKLLYYISRPAGRLVFIKPAEAFVTYIKLAVFCGIFLSMPVIIYEIWMFVSPGLRSEEKKPLIIFAPISLILFLAGSSFSYFVIIPVGIKFFTGFSSLWLTPMISVGNYVSFFCMMFFLFGLVFELPVVILFLTRLRLVSPEGLRHNRRYVVLMVFIVSAVITPPDVFTQIMMALPLLVLYESSILISAVFTGRKK